MASKILIIGPSWVGDTVMAQSLLKLLKQQEAAVVLDVLAPAWTFSLLSCMPEVSLAIEMPLTHGELKLGERYRMARQLRDHQYDQAIVLPGSWKSALIPWMARIPKRTGWLGEYRYGLLNDVRKPDKKRYALMIEQYVALGLPVNAPVPFPLPHPEFQVTKAAQEAVLARHRPIWRGRPILALCAGAEFGPAKRWPEAYYAAVANQKLAEGWDVWLFGSQNDKPVTDHIMALTEQGCENMAGRLQLAETIALLSLTTGMVTNDSGLMHVAAALNKPLIAVYGPTSPAFTPPLSKTATVLQQSLPCQPCFQRVCPLEHHHCMLDLTPDRVLGVMTGWSVD